MFMMTFSNEPFMVKNLLGCGICISTVPLPSKRVFKALLLCIRKVNYCYDPVNRTLEAENSSELLLNALEKSYHNFTSKVRS